MGLNWNETKMNYIFIIVIYNKTEATDNGGSKICNVLDERKIIEWGRQVIVLLF